ncbi:MAG: hypothetical protein FWE80_09845, partial [Oscillospiraceae bacterium]|nr:hypothetical protein [Oscillospiraceae bacterium]
MKLKIFDFKRIVRENLFLLVFLFSALAVLVVSGITIRNMGNTVENMDSAKEHMNITEDFLVRNYKSRLQAIAGAARNLLTAEDLDALRIRPGSPDNRIAWLKDDGFLNLRRRLIRFGAENEIEFIYFYFRIDDFLQPLIDNDPYLSDAYTPANGLIRLDNDARDAWNGKKTVVATGELFIDRDGLITAYAPVFDDDGEVMALIGVDIRDEQIQNLRGQIGLLSERAESLSGYMVVLIIGMAAALTLLLTGGILTVLANGKRAKVLQSALR